LLIAIRFYDADLSLRPNTVGTRLPSGQFLIFFTMIVFLGWRKMGDSLLVLPRLNSNTINAKSSWNSKYLWVMLYHDTFCLIHSCSHLILCSDADLALRHVES
jgi:hypothetical protein